MLTAMRGFKQSQSGFPEGCSILTMDCAVGDAWSDVLEMCRESICIVGKQLATFYPRILTNIDLAEICPLIRIASVPLKLSSVDDLVFKGAVDTLSLCDRMVEIVELASDVPILGHAFKSEVVAATSPSNEATLGNLRSLYKVLPCLSQFNRFADHLRKFLPFDIVEATKLNDKAFMTRFGPFKSYLTELTQLALTVKTHTVEFVSYAFVEPEIISGFIRV